MKLVLVDNEGLILNSNTHKASPSTQEFGTTETTPMSDLFKMAEAEAKKASTAKPTV